MTALTNLEGRRDLAVLGWHGMCRLYREQRVLILRTAMGCSQAQPRLTANSSVSAAAHAINAGAGVMFHIEYLCLQAPLLGLYFHMAPSVPSVVVR